MRNTSYLDSAFAEHYDFIIEKLGISQLEDEFWLSAAKRFGSPILEIGCGTGRLLLYLAKHGYQVTGLDYSKAMLDILDKKIKSCEMDVKKLVNYKIGDMIKPPFDGSLFKLICFCGSQFLHLKTDRARLDCLKNCRKLLAKGGAVIISNSKLIGKRENRFTQLPLQEGDAWSLSRRRSVIGKVCTVTIKLTKLSGTPKERVFSWCLRRVERGHIEYLIKQAGMYHAPITSLLEVADEKSKDFYICLAQ